MPAADIIPPADVRHQLFADAVIRGENLVDAYLQAGYNCSRKSAAPNATKLRKRGDVDAYIRAVQESAADASVLSLLEKRRFLARVVRTPLIKIDPESEHDENADLVKKYEVRAVGEMETSTKFEKYDALKAIEIDNKLSGDDPESKATNALAAAIAALGTDTPLPKDRM